MHFLNLSATSCCLSLGFFSLVFVILSNPSYCGLHDGNFVFPTTQEPISLPTSDMEIPGWRTVASVSGWKLSIRSSWDVLGPFPQHAREQHFLSPSFPFRSTLVMLHRRFILIYHVPRRGPCRSQDRYSFPVISCGWWICWVDQRDVRRRREVSGIISERAVGIISPDLCLIPDYS